MLLVNAVHEVIPVSRMRPPITHNNLLDVSQGILANSQQAVKQIAGKLVPIAA